ncbi:MAG: GFA family protein [Myxococcales bacterium]|nr:GFA family protein [Myxococcales bacterium]MCB9734002.1 GFA family protein [Deltaproteobacteria bacterium]
MKYEGSCHCGNVAFEAEGEIDSVIACNCSMCRRKGSLLWFVPFERFHLKQGAEALKSYKFNKNVIDHQFCTTCGMHPFAEGVDPKGNKIAAINVRCLEGVDLDALDVHHYDGASA